jgi:dTMP kinase
LTGLFITMEGVEGSGKSTQIWRLAERLNNAGYPLLVSKEPGGTKLGAELRRLLLAHHESGEVWSPEAELLLFYADRAQHVATVIRPALAEDKLVLVDRFEDSSWAYQGAKGVSDAKLGHLKEVVLDGFKPDLTLILDMDPIQSLMRVEARNRGLGASFQETRFDQEALEYHQKVRLRFLEIARKDPGRVVLIQAQGAVEDVETAIWQAVSGFLHRRGFKGI